MQYCVHWFQEILKLNEFIQFQKGYTLLKIILNSIRTI